MTFAHTEKRKGDTYVIAEIGSCHDGKLHQGLRLVEAAAVAGANAVKAQYWSNPDQLAERRRATPAYREIYRRYAVDLLAIRMWSDHAQMYGLDFMCTTYLPQDVAAIAPFVRHFKVASFEAEALDLLMAHLSPMHAAPTKALFVSTGMGGRIPHVFLRAFNAIGPGDNITFGPRLVVLRCVSAYPAPVRDLQLRRFHPSLINDGPWRPDGLSDHTDPALTWTGALAVAAGARYIEAHLRLRETNPDNPDAPHAMLPEQFEDYVKHIRFAEACVGTEMTAAIDGAVLESEQAMAAFRVVPVPPVRGARRIELAHEGGE